MSRQLKSTLVAGAVAGALAGMAGPAWGAGFALIEQGASGQGNAYAGGAAEAADSSTIFFNPAGMSRLDRPEALGALHLIDISFSYSDAGSRQIVNPVSGASIPLLPTSDRFEDGGQGAVVPTFYYARPLQNDMHVGLAVNVPFGLTTKYNPNWVGRYQAVTSKISTVRITPALSWKATDAVSIGGGISAQYIDAKLSNAIDFSAVCLGGAAAATCTAPAPGQGLNDGFVKNTADDWSLGWNAGILVEPVDGTRVGVAYRSQIKHKAKGRAAFSVPQGISTNPLVQAGIQNTFSDDGITVNVTLPETWSFSAHHQVNDKLAVMGDASWTGWSSIPRLIIEFDNPATAGGPGIEELDWKDSWRAALGLTYAQSSKLTFRTGVAYDEGVSPSAELRSARLPDADRKWVSIGLGYKQSDQLIWDVGFSHLRVANANIRRTGSTGNVLNGSYRSHSNILAAQARYLF